jgi:oxygen-independent coproporphyrinogen-3 oxidase
MMVTVPAPLPPLSLYIHLPWCVRKCPYCDFNSHALGGVLPEAAYVDALFADLEEEASRIGDRRVDTVFFGGGTPSLFGADSLGRVLEWLRDRALLAEDAEVTLEANPGTVERGCFSDYRAAGVNRVSLGVQSFDPARLEQLGRIHGVREIHDALEELSRAGLENFNIDLMFGLPEQDAEAACADLAAALSAHPAHVSHYQLTLEPNTLFWHRPPPLPDEDSVWDMQVRCGELLDDAGFDHYEISAYAKDDRACRHNLNYWRYGDYLGVGAGAHGKLTTAGGREIRRRSKLRHPAAYLDASDSRVQAETPVVVGERVFEFMLNALRLRAGFEAGLFRARTGLDPDAAEPALGEARRRGLLEVDDQCWRPTELGRRFLNDLQALFLPTRNV